MSELSNLPYAYILVTEPVLQRGPNEKVPPFVSYLISGQDPHGEYNIRRRFREFLLLRNKLVERFTGIYIPPIPSKRAAVIFISFRVTQKKGMLRKEENFCNIFVQRLHINHICLIRTFFKHS